MKTEDAPLYSRSYDLTRWLIERALRFPRNHRFGLAQRIQNTAMDFLEHVVLALQDRDERAAHLRAADAALTRLRLAARLARDLDLLRGQQVDFVHRELGEIGRMLGGWRRKESYSHAGPE